MTSRPFAAAFLVGVCAVVGHAEKTSRARGVAAIARVEHSVPFKVGETLTYDVSWSSYLTAGTAVASVKEKKSSDRSTAYYIVVEGRPTPLLSSFYNVFYKLDTLLDAYTLLPQRGSLYTEEGSRHKYKVTQFDRQAQEATFESRSSTEVKQTVRTPPRAQDVLSALYVLRAMALKPGDRLTLPVCNDGENYRVQVAVEAPERVSTPLGEMTAWRLRPTIVDSQGRQPGRNLAMWISDDARRLPLKMQAELPVGTFNLTLREAR